MEALSRRFEVQTSTAARIFATTMRLGWLARAAFVVVRSSCCSVLDFSSPSNAEKSCAQSTFRVDLKRMLESGKVLGPSEQNSSRSRIKALGHFRRNADFVQLQRTELDCRFNFLAHPLFAFHANANFAATYEAQFLEL